MCFDNMAVGERTLAEKMKYISKEAELSKVYTNHSIRATAVTALDKCWHEAGHIMARIVATKVSEVYRATAKQTLTPKSFISCM